MLPDDQVHPDTHVLTMVNNVIAVVNNVIAARPSPLNFVIADTAGSGCLRLVVVESWLSEWHFVGDGRPEMRDAAWLAQPLPGSVR